MSEIIKIDLNKNGVIQHVGEIKREDIPDRIGIVCHILNEKGDFNPLNEKSSTKILMYFDISKLPEDLENDVRRHFGLKPRSKIKKLVMVQG